jgi:hypothetical protein
LVKKFTLPQNYSLKGENSFLVFLKDIVSFRVLKRAFLSFENREHHKGGKFMAILYFRKAFINLIENF